jgi:hypothetical protein
MDIKIIYSLKTAVLSLCLGLLISLSSNAEIKLSPQWTERYLFKHFPILLKNSHTDHVLAFYYFGSFEDFTIMGMERVKGDDYEPHHTVLVFKDSVLQGYYEELVVFPAGVSAQGQVFFPANLPVGKNIELAMGQYPNIIFKGDLDTTATFHTVKSAK